MLDGAQLADRARLAPVIVARASCPRSGASIVAPASSRRFSAGRRDELSFLSRNGWPCAGRHF